jgi:hypothetical protein
MARHRISYRFAGFQGVRESAPLEEVLRQVLSGAHAENYTDRIFKVSDRHLRAVINRSDLDPPGVLAEVFQLDPRRTLPFVQHREEPAPVARVRTREVPTDEEHIGLPAYFLVLGNHLAVIESAGLGSSQLQTYLNALFQSAGVLAPDEHWKLTPKIEVVEGTAALSQGITRLEVKPIARLAGDAPSQMDDRRPPRRTRSAVEARETKLQRGPKIFALLEALGASNAELSDLRARMSTDLGLEAKLVISVQRNARATDATLSPADVSQAVASLEEENVVTMVTPDGTQRGRLISLSTSSEIADDGGLLELDGAMGALATALQVWGGRGVIDLGGG